MRTGFPRERKLKQSRAMPRLAKPKPAMPSAGPDFSHEEAARATGRRRVARCLDEVGRGPLAGPVVVAAVVFPDGIYPEGLNDSKKLTEKRREALFLDILALGEAAIIASAEPDIIDRLNIRGATLWAMRRAVLSLPHAADYALIDGRDVPPGLPCPAEALIKGDGRSVSIAAPPSILAKVARDRMCPVMDVDAPGYGFAGHKAYGTAVHMESAQDARCPPPHPPALFRSRGANPWLTLSFSLGLTLRRYKRLVSVALGLSACCVSRVSSTRPRFRVPKKTACRSIPSSSGIASSA